MAKIRKLATRLAVALPVIQWVWGNAKPHIDAYRLAKQIDGFVGGWPGDEGTHWLVFATRDGDPVRSFPPVSSRELETAGAAIDRGGLKHHSELIERQAIETARGAVENVRRTGSGRAIGSRSSEVAPARPAWQDPTD